MTLVGSKPSSPPLTRRDISRIGLLSTYPPTRCGIAKFSQSLVRSLSLVAPDVELDVIRLVDEWSPQTETGGPEMEITPELPIARRAAAKRLNASDVVIIQHEFGIYGPNDGVAVIDLVSRISRPSMIVLHTVLADPTPTQRMIIESLARQSLLVVPSKAALQILTSRYAVSQEKVKVIRHGAWWLPTPPSNRPPSNLITWGLIGPGKGIERAIRAMAGLRALEPRPVYRIVGGTHPTVARQQGIAYRRMLEALAWEAGVEDMVEFVDRYLTEDELEDMVRKSDIVLVPYDNDEQTSSGVLTEALSAGRPVVATRFPYALELLAGGAGLAVSHDSSELANAIRRLLTDPVLYARCSEKASQTAPELAWVSSGYEYLQAAQGLLREQDRRHIPSPPAFRRV